MVGSRSVDLSPSGQVSHLVLRIPAIDDDVTGVENWRQLLNEVVDGDAGLHHQHHPARLLQLGHEVL